jgi:hypothetical protein
VWCALSTPYGIRPPPALCGPGRPGKPLEDSFCQEDKEQEGMLSGSLSGSAGSSRHGTRGGGGACCGGSYDEEDGDVAGSARAGFGKASAASEKVALLASTNRTPPG